MKGIKIQGASNKITFEFLQFDEETIRQFLEDVTMFIVDKFPDLEKIGVEYNGEIIFFANKKLIDKLRSSSSGSGLDALMGEGGETNEGQSG